MQSGDKPSETNVQLTSLQTWWGAKRQARWSELQKQAVDSSLQLYLNDRPNFENFYAYVAEKRIAIAEELSKGIVPEMKTARFVKGEESNIPSSYTIIKDIVVSFYSVEDDKYKDFLAPLISQFNELAKKNTLETIEQTYSSDYGITGMQVLAFSAKKLEIKYNDTLYSTLTKLDCIIDDDDEGQSKKEWIHIKHTPPYNIPIAMECASKLYDSLRNENHAANKIKIIKTVAWHLAHAMPRLRGSAAICEIIIESLLLANGIKLDVPKSPIPMDLIAIFSSSPEDFSKKIMLNTQIEMKEALNEILDNEKKYPTHNNIFTNTNTNITIISKKLLQWLDKKEEVAFSQEELSLLQSKPLNDVFKNYKAIDILNNNKSTFDSMFVPFKP